MKTSSSQLAVLFMLVLAISTEEKPQTGGGFPGEGTLIVDPASPMVPSFGW